MISPIGKLTLASSGGFLTNLYFDGEEPEYSLEERFDPSILLGDVGEFSVLTKAKIELEEYFDGKRKAFETPLNPAGGEYFKRIWRTMSDILCYGTVITYSKLAKINGNEKAARAVGMANNRNPIPIFIPCHRVVGKSGKLTGFRGGLSMKEQLLKLEKVEIEKQ